MTKIYLGNDEYEIHLNSGQTLVISETDLEEMGVGTQKLKGDIEVLEDELNDFEDSFNEKVELITEIEAITQSLALEDSLKVRKIRDML